MTASACSSRTFAGGVGLNLTAARQVVFNDLDWVPANHWQAEDRAYRIGQTGSVTVTYMIGPESVDDFVSGAGDEGGLVDAVIEGKAVSGADYTGVLAGLERLLGRAVGSRREYLGGGS